MAGIEVGVACSGGATRAGGLAEEENGGGGAPVSSGRGGGVGELREVEVELMEGSAREDGLRRGGSTTASSSPAFGQSGGGVLGSWVGEMAKERGERVAGLLVVLVHARGESGGLYPVLSTAAARWRTAVVFWACGTGMEAPARGVEGGGSLGATRGEASRQEVASRPFHSGGRQHRCLPAAWSRGNRQASWRKEKMD
jgi:hypothetical protein